MSPNEMDGDIYEWGDMREMLVKGLSALGYPSGSQDEFISGSGKPPVPLYFPKHQIQALDHAIENMEDKYKHVLILKFVCKLDDVAINKEGLCHRNTVPKWISEAKHLLVISKYWKI